MSWNTGSIRNFCCGKTVMALCTTGLSECFFTSSVTTSQRILNLNFSNRYSSITHTSRFLFIYFLYNPPIHKKQNLCVSRLLTLPADVMFGSLIDYQLLSTKVPLMSEESKEISFCLQWALHCWCMVNETSLPLQLWQGQCSHHLLW